MNTLPALCSTTSSPSQARNMVARLRELAHLRPLDTALIVTSAQGDRTIDYASLDARVRALAARLQQQFAPGDRALVMCDNDDHYAVAFFACLYAGLIAVPVFPPASKREQHLARLVGIANDAQARCLLTPAAMLSHVEAMSQACPSAVPLAIDEVPDSMAERWQARAPQGADIAFLQYTSGSTAAPKGVMVSHANLMANERALQSSLGTQAGDVFVSWLPLYHDMGLIAGLLQPIHVGIPLVLMSPTYFLEQPLRWLEAISRHRGTISGGPDFAYRLCIERLDDEQCAGLDLSSWKLAFSGAEPVRHDTLHEFVTRFAAAGFQPQALYPCYGLAEVTLMATGGMRGSGMTARRFEAQALAQGKAEVSAQGSMLVACGVAPPAHEVAIFEPNTQVRLESGLIGEIWVSGPSVAQGYWQRLKESAETFVERGVHRWLRTGDLGFILDGQLYIAGRIKDVIILRGQNVYPQDIERAIEAEVDVVRKGRVAAFSVPKPDGGEGVGVAVEIAPGLRSLLRTDALIEALSQAVSTLCREPVSVALLLEPGTLPKTSSGKLQRSACRQAWQDRSLSAYGIYEHGRFVLGGEAGSASDTQPLTGDIEPALAEIWRMALPRCETIRLGRDAHFFALGGHSLSAVQTAARIADRWRIDFPVRLMFEMPRLADCASEVQRRLSFGRMARRPTIAALPVGARRAALPLSHAQQRQWFLWQLEPASVVNHVGGTVRLLGQLDATALQSAFNGLVARHESLRTVFRAGADGMAGQWVQPAMTLDLPLVDLRTCPHEEREAQARRQAEGLHAKPFDLTQGPLLRAQLIRMEEAEHVLVLVMHHIVSDGASMQVLLRELGQRYRAGLEGRELALPEPVIQYADYAAWQRGWLQGGEHARQLACWRERLGTAHPVLALPVDHARQAVANYRAARHGFLLPQPLLHTLRQRAEAHDASLFMLLLSGFQAVLHRHTGQQDIRVGVPVANRHHAETQDVIGLFVNTLVLRNVVRPRMSLTELLARTREAALEAQSNQDLPFEQLVEALAPVRSLGHAPLVQVTANHVVEDAACLGEAMGLRSAKVEVMQQAVQFELTLETTETADGQVSASLVYAAELFEPETIAAFAGHYLRMLDALASDPQQTVDQVPLLSQPERAQLAEWGGASSCGGPRPAVHQLIEGQARTSPDAPALVYEDGATLTYAELNARANQLAHRLIASGVRPESRVGIALARSLDMVVALLATLKAGAAYVPLDPDYPQDRLGFMVQDSGIALLITQSSLRSRVPCQGALAVIDVDDDAHFQGPQDNPQVAMHAEQLAYVIYTSGSTGRPKGVAVAHGPLSMHLQAIGEIYGVGPGHRELFFFSLSFDAAVEQWMTPLCGGGTLVLCSRERLAGDSVVRLMAEHAINALHVPPAYLRLLLPRLGAAGARVRTCIVGGEAWPKADLEAARAAFDKPWLINAYGPTETIITPTAWAGGADELPVGSHAPIGRPVGERTAHVLDAALNLVPRGVAGELYIGGAGLARGYGGQPGLTSERFVADPFSDGGGRLYRTGDLVRWRLDGQLDYLGRLDQQVKVRGFRIELGEIEALLRAQPGVREAVVVAREDGADTRIVAYACPHPGTSLDTGSLKEAMARTLPDYMRPNAIVALSVLPLGPNGKVDRTALPAPEFAPSASYEAPRGAMARSIAEIWAEALQVPRVGLRDNFFDLGGHSLLLIKVHAWLTERLGVTTTLVDLFRHPTVAALAAHLEQGQKADATPVAQGVRARASRQRQHFIQRTPTAKGSTP